MAKRKFVKAQREWLTSVHFVKRRRGSGYVVTVRRKLGDLAFTWYESRPLPVKAQAEAHAKAVVRGFERGRPVQAVVWWTWRCVERTVRQGEQTKKVFAGTVRKWIGDGSFVWREISPQDTREEAERIARQTVEAGQALQARGYEHTCYRVVEAHCTDCGAKCADDPGVAR